MIKFNEDVAIKKWLPIVESLRFNKDIQNSIALYCEWHSIIDTMNGGSNILPLSIKTLGDIDFTGVNIILPNDKILNRKFSIDNVIDEIDNHISDSISTKQFKFTMGLTDLSADIDELQLTIKEVVSREIQNDIENSKQEGKTLYFIPYIIIQEIKFDSSISHKGENVCYVTSKYGILNV